MGEFLVKQQFFSDERATTAQLHYEQDRYRLQFVIKPQYVDDPRTASQCGLLGNRITHDVLGGRAIEVGFSDGHLKRIKAIPLGAVMEFGKSELYLSEPVTAVDARAVGELLTQNGVFSDDRMASVGSPRRRTLSRSSS